MSQNRYKGIECDQCGRSTNIGLRLNFSVLDIYTRKPKDKRRIESVEFFADFCSKDCLKVFLNRYYFESVVEIEEEDE